MQSFFLFLFSISFLNSAYSQQKKLLIIGIDGCRADAITKEIAPVIDSIIHLPNTAYTYKMKNERHTMSAPNWTSMLTGVHCSRHHAKTNSFKRNKISKYPHFFKRLEDADSTIYTASYPHWMHINKFIVNGNADEAPYTKEEPTDSAVKDRAVKWLMKEKTPDAMFIHFDDVDHNGHASGFSPLNKKYTDAVSKTDKNIRTIFQMVEERKKKFKEEWLVIISTDHGGRKHRRLGGHAIGIFNKHIRQVFLVINGNAAQPGEIVKANTVDVAATVLNFFGIPIKEEWKMQGKPVGLKH